MAPASRSADPQVLALPLDEVRARVGLDVAAIDAVLPSTTTVEELRDVA